MHDYQSFSLRREEKDALLRDISAILSRRPEILFAYAHGSFLEEQAFRDLDLAVYLSSEQLPAARFAYEDALAQELIHELHLPFTIDLRLLNGAPVSFLYRVFDGRLVVDRDTDLRIDLMAYSISRYLDIKPILEHHLKELFPHET